MGRKVIKLGKKRGRKTGLSFGGTLLLDVHTRGAEVATVSPLDALAVLPVSFSRFLVGCGEDGLAVLLTMTPAPLVFPPVGPIEDPLAVLLIVLVFADILASIWPRIDTLTMHEVLLPIALILAAILPLIRPKPMHRIVLPFAPIGVPIGPFVGAYSITTPFLVVSNVAASIGPTRLALAMLYVVLPDSLVDGAVSAVEDPVAIALIVFEFAFVEVAVSVPERALAVRLIVLPLALVLGSVLPDLNAEAVADTACAVVHFVAKDRVHACLRALRGCRWRLEKLGVALLTENALRACGVLMEGGLPVVLVRNFVNDTARLCERVFILRPKGELTASKN